MAGARRFGSLLFFLLAWETASQLRLVPAFFLPSWVSIVQQARADFASGQLPADILLSMYRALAGLLLAVLAGVPLGAAMGRVKAVRWFFDPLVSIWLPAPKITFFPIFIIWFGFANMSKIALVFVACIFPIVNMTYLGTMNIDRYLVWSARNMGTGERKILWKVVLPAALPQVFNGLQIAFPISLIVTSVTEMLGGGGGVGATMMESARFADMPRVFVYLLVLALVGAFSMSLVTRLRGLLLHWHEEARAGR